LPVQGFDFASFARYTGFVFHVRLGCGSLISAAAIYCVFEEAVECSPHELFSSGPGYVETPDDVIKHFYGLRLRNRRYPTAPKILLTALLRQHAG